MITSIGHSLSDVLQCFTKQCILACNKHININYSNVISRPLHVILKGKNNCDINRVVAWS